MDKNKSEKFTGYYTSVTYKNIFALPRVGIPIYNIYSYVVYIQIHLLLFYIIGISIRNTEILDFLIVNQPVYIYKSIY